LLTLSGIATGTTAAPLHWVLNNKSAAKPAQCGPAVPMVVLRNVHVGSLQDSDNAWPPYLDLEGFHYERLGGRTYRRFGNETTSWDPPAAEDWRFHVGAFAY
jgi:hypothetical protein